MPKLRRGRAVELRHKGGGCGKKKQYAEEKYYSNTDPKPSFHVYRTYGDGPKHSFWLDSDRANAALDLLPRCYNENKLRPAVCVINVSQISFRTNFLGSMRDHEWRKAAAFTSGGQFMDRTLTGRHSREPTVSNRGKCLFSFERC